MYHCVPIEFLLHMLYNNHIESFRYHWRSVAQSPDVDPLSLGTDEVTGEECCVACVMCFLFNSTLLCLLPYDCFFTM